MNTQENKNDKALSNKNYNLLLLLEQNIRYNFPDVCVNELGEDCYFDSVSIAEHNEDKLIVNFRDENYITIEESRGVELTITIDGKFRDEISNSKGSGGIYSKDDIFDKMCKVMKKYS